MCVCVHVCVCVWVAKLVAVELRQEVSEREEGKDRPNLSPIPVAYHVYVYEPRHEKTGFLHNVKTKPQISCTVTTLVCD